MSIRVVFGLLPSEKEKLNAVFREISELECVWIYGSRAQGKERRGSDIDLALKFSRNHRAALAQIQSVLDDILILYEIDIVDIDNIKDKAFLQELDRTKQLFWKRR